MDLFYLAKGNRNYLSQSFYGVTLTIKVQIYIFLNLPLVIVNEVFLSLIKVLLYKCSTINTATFTPVQ